MLKLTYTLILIFISGACFSQVEPPNGTCSTAEALALGTSSNIEAIENESYVTTIYYYFHGTGDYVEADIQPISNDQGSLFAVTDWSIHSTNDNQNCSLSNTLVSNEFPTPTRIYFNDSELFILKIEYRYAEIGDVISIDLPIVDPIDNSNSEVFNGTSNSTSAYWRGFMDFGVDRVFTSQGFELISIQNYLGGFCDDNHYEIGLYSSYPQNNTALSYGIYANDFPGSLYVEDLNEDGQKDFFVVSKFYSGNGYFQYFNTARELILAQSFEDPILEIIIADIDHDELNDIIVSDEAQNVQWMRNLGDNDFAAPVTISTGAIGNIDIEISDLNLDGANDIIFSTASTLAWIQNSGDGTFGEIHEIATGSFPASGVGYVDSNSSPDIIAGNFWFQNNGDGTFDEPSTINSMGNQNVVIDLEGDGDIDILARSGNTITSILNDGNGNFSAALPFTTSQSISTFDLFDADQDGDLDFFYSFTQNIDAGWGSVCGNFNYDVERVNWHENMLDPIRGCIDDLACNYNEEALHDDGSCSFIDDSCDDNNVNTVNDLYNDACECIGDDAIPDCTNSVACNYDSTANLDDGTCKLVGDICDDLNVLTMNDVIVEDCSCQGELIIEGCMNVTACNYDSIANVDNGNCQFINDPCDDSNSETINDIFQSDCSCIGESQVFGCMNESAVNFNEEANSDDGSCVFAGDFDNNGGVGVSDLSIFLAVFGASCDNLEPYCIGDLNGDGHVNVYSNHLAFRFLAGSFSLYQR